MILLAAACVGVFVYLVAGLVLGRVPRLARLPRHADPIDRQRTWLLQAGVRVGVGRFWALSAALGLVAFVVAWSVTRAPLIALVPALVAGMVPRAVVARRRQRRLREVLDAWPDALRELIASIAAGRSLTQAIISLAESGPEPLRHACARFPSLAPMLGTAAALEIVKEELADPTSDRIIEVLVLAHERGGQIVKEILEDLVVTTTKDLKLLDEIETEGLEMKINARAVLILPWLVLVALTLRGGPFRDFYQSPAGLLVVLAGGALSAIGYAWISRLGRAHVEPRVFGSPAMTPSAGRQEVAA
jgi:tight adherence protein B